MVFGIPASYPRYWWLFSPVQSKHDSSFKLRIDRSGRRSTRIDRRVFCNLCCSAHAKSIRDPFSQPSAPIFNRDLAINEGSDRSIDLQRNLFMGSKRFKDTGSCLRPWRSRTLRDEL